MFWSWALPAPFSWHRELQRAFWWGGEGQLRGAEGGHPSGSGKEGPLVRSLGWGKSLLGPGKALPTLQGESGLASSDPLCDSRQIAFLLGPIHPSISTVGGKALPCLFAQEGQGLRASGKRGIRQVLGLGSGCGGGEQTEKEERRMRKGRYTHEKERTEKHMRDKRNE